MVKGIGPVLAKQIIETRQKAGPFTSHDDLRRVRGIGSKRLEQIRPYLRPIPDSSNAAEQGKAAGKGKS